MSRQPDRLSDQRVSDWTLTTPCTMVMRDAVALAQEVQERRALDAQRKCATCVGCQTETRWAVVCDRLGIFVTTDHFCAKWEARP